MVMGFVGTFEHGCHIIASLIQSNLAIRNFLVAPKLFLNAKSSLYLLRKWQIGHGKWFLNTNLFLIKPFLIAKFDCICQFTSELTPNLNDENSIETNSVHCVLSRFYSFISVSFLASYKLIFDFCLQNFCMLRLKQNIVHPNEIVAKVSFTQKHTLQKFNIPISIDISIKTHQFVCIRQN